MPRSMTKSRGAVLAGVFLVGAAIALFLALAIGRSSGTTVFTPKAAAAETESAADSPGVGANSYDAWQSAIRTYPANAIPPAVVARAKATFERIAKRDAQLRLHGRSFFAGGGSWSQYGP